MPKSRPPYPPEFRKRIIARTRHRVASRLTMAFCETKPNVNSTVRPAPHRQARPGRLGLRSEPPGGALSAVQRADGCPLRASPASGHAARWRTVHLRALGGNRHGDEPGGGAVGEPLVPGYHGIIENPHTEWPSLGATPPFTLLVAPAGCGCLAGTTFVIECQIVKGASVLPSVPKVRV
jgi:hypothetical protein